MEFFKSPSTFSVLFPETSQQLSSIRKTPHWEKQRIRNRRMWGMGGIQEDGQGRLLEKGSS